MNYFLLNIGQQLINLTPALLRFSSNIFVQSLIKTSLKSCTKVYMGKQQRPTKARSPFYEEGIPVGWEYLFSYKQIFIFQTNCF